MEYEIIKMKIEMYDNLISFWKSIEGLCHEDDEYDELDVYFKRNPGLNFAAVRNNEIIGTVKCGHDGRRGYLHHLAVKKEFRKKGIANQLIEKCMKELKNQGIKKCNLFVYDMNNEALKFWKHNNWIELKYDYRTFQKPTIFNKQ